MSQAARQLIGSEVPGGAADAGALHELAEQSLLRLQAHTAGLDEIVRDGIRRAFIAECGALVQEAQLAAEALAHLQRRARRHFGALSALAELLSVAGGLVLAGGWLPSRSEAARLRAEQAQLSHSVAQLVRLGGRVQWRRCGPQERLCARVDVKAPVYGRRADFYVLEGY